ncbi:MAG TPA: exosortase/archaeosortase family protein [Verrucomicrobiae bacterium]
MGPADQVRIALAPHQTGNAATPFRFFWIATGVLALCFGKVLFDLIRHALNESLHSHIFLVPFVSAYLLHLQCAELPRVKRGPNLTSGICWTVAVFSLAGYAIMRPFLSHNDYLSLTVLSFVCFVFANVACFLGTAFFKAAAFPILFLLFLVPLPDFLVNALEIASQFGSAEVYSWMMNLSGATYYREARTFVLPNLTIVVAQECSGIRSSLVLFITSLIAGHMFLRTTWKKWVLALAVFPLGLIRNAFRIYILSMASAHWNPDVIHSPIHHRGGPIFFALSLVPFFLLLLWLRRKDCKRPNTVISASSPS